MRAHTLAAAAALSAIALAAATPAAAGTYGSYTSLLGGTVIDFEGLADGAMVDTQYAGVTFSQTAGGLPIVDQYDWTFGYGASSGDHVLRNDPLFVADTGFVQAGIRATFASGHNGVEVFLSDTSPLGAYPISFLAQDGSVLAQYGVAQNDILPPGYDPMNFRPPPGTSPLAGVFVGYTSAANDIWGVLIGPSTHAEPFIGEIFAIDDLRFTTGPAIDLPPGGVPEPGTWALLLGGFGGLGAMLRRRRAAAVA